MSLDYSLTVYVEWRHQSEIEGNQKGAHLGQGQSQHEININPIYSLITHSCLIVDDSSVHIIPNLKKKKVFAITH